MFCTKQFVGNVGEWLMKYAEKLKQPNVLIEESSAILYLGKIKESIRLQYPSNEIWIGHDSGDGQKLQGMYAERAWFTKLTQNLRRESRTETIIQGGVIEAVFDPVGRKECLDIIEYLLKQNDREAIAEASALCLTYHSMGRSGEYALIHYTQV